MLLLREGKAVDAYEGGEIGGNFRGDFLEFIVGRVSGDLEAFCTFALLQHYSAITSRLRDSLIRRMQAAVCFPAIRRLRKSDPRPEWKHSASPKFSRSRIGLGRP